MKHWRSAITVFLLGLAALAQNRPPLNDAEKAIESDLRKLRSLPDDEWVKSVASAAARIHALPAGPAKESLLGSLGNLCTEGDAGQQTLQLIASTMEDVLRTSPQSNIAQQLAMLVNYEHVKASSDSPKFRSTLAQLEEEDRKRQNANFTLPDLSGKTWSLRDLRGKVVIVNFWATWCPPCRKEMPDMEALYQRFGPRGLVILAISDEDRAKVAPFIAERKYSYPILLDAGAKVQEEFNVHGIPKTFVYDRQGKLVAAAMDRRTERQFLEMLKLAGLDGATN